MVRSRVVRVLATSLALVLSFGLGALVVNLMQLGNQSRPPVPLSQVKPSAPTSQMQQTGGGGPAHSLPPSLPHPNLGETGTFQTVQNVSSKKNVSHLGGLPAIAQELVQLGMLKQETFSNQIAFHLKTVLDDMGLMYWPIEGTLAGLLRWGNNFGITSNAIYVTDNDIDVMIEVNNDAHWDMIKATLREKLSGDGPKSAWRWAGCIEANHNVAPVRKLPKFKCSTSAKFPFVGADAELGTGDVHIDFHSYLVSKDLNVIAMDSVCFAEPHRCSTYWPFQAWGGNAPYRGLIVDENGRFRKVKVNAMEWPSAFDPITLMKKWNKNEYRSNTPHLPPNGFCISGSEYPAEQSYKAVSVVLTKIDILSLCQQSLLLNQSGFQSWSLMYSKDCLKEAAEAGGVAGMVYDELTDQERQCLAYSQRRCSHDEKYSCK